MRLSSVLISVISLLVTDSTPAHPPSIDINDHFTVIQTIGTSDTPLLAWQKIVGQHPDPEAAERAADAVLAWLPNIPSQTAFVPLLKLWQRHQPITTQASNDHGHIVGTYLIAARATGELNRLLKEQTERHIYYIATSQPETLLSEYTKLLGQSHAAITSGLSSALHQLTTAQQQYLIRQQLADPKVTTSTAFLAAELNNSDLHAMVIYSDQTQAKIQLLNDWQKHPPTSSEWLIIAAQQPGPQQRQALNLLTQVTLSNTDIDWLMTLLGDQKLGRTAARVLGKQKNHELTHKLFTRWQQESNQQIKTNLLYGLSRNPMGLTKLASIMQQKSSSSLLTPNQQQWLQGQLEVRHD